MTTKTITLTPELAKALLEAMQPVIDGDSVASQITLMDDNGQEIEIVCRAKPEEGENRR